LDKKRNDFGFQEVMLIEDIDYPNNQFSIKKIPNDILVKGLFEIAGINDIACMPILFYYFSYVHVHWVVEHMQVFLYRYTKYKLAYLPLIRCQKSLKLECYLLRLDRTGMILLLLFIFQSWCLWLGNII
jgi:hypothetical protein